jgi:hypothetical protein
MTSSRAHIIAAVIAAAAVIIAACIALLGSSGSVNNCPADHSSTTNCANNG